MIQVVAFPFGFFALTRPNAQIFAYGQTSSGKSFSMIGKLADDMTQGLSENAGIIPRVAHLLFATSHSQPDTHQFFVEASFIEIYNEKVRVFKKNK